MASDPPPSAASTATRAFPNPSPKTPTPTPTPTTTPTPLPPQAQPQPQPQLQQKHQPLYGAQAIANLPVRSPNPQFPKPHDASQAFLYPVASTGRGFVPKSIRPQPSSHAVGGFPQRPVVSYQQGARPNLDPVHMMRPPLVHHHHPPGTASASAPIKGIPVSAHPKVALSPSSVPDSNGYKNLRDRSRDDSLVILRERRVRISDGSSLYAMCRSWLKNGFHEEAKPQFVDGTKSLPRPLPIPVVDANLSKRKEDEEEEEENEESVEHLSAQDLLKRHIKRAKRVRSGLREERLQRIARYKTRLALLLPPPVEPLRNDAATGN